MTDRPGLFRALGYRNYRLFASGQIISLIGTWMQTVAESWLVYRPVCGVKPGGIGPASAGQHAR